MASDKIKGLTVAIAGDTTEFVKSLTNAENELKSLQKEYSRVNSGLKLDSSSTELLTQKSTILTKEIEALSSKLLTLKANQEEVNKGQDSMGQKVPVEEIRKYNTEVAHTEAYLQNLKNQLATTNEKLAESGDGVQNVSDKMKEGGNSADQYREALSTIFNEFNISLAAVTAGLVKLGQQAVDIGIEFESAFAGVKKTVDATDAELAQMRDGLLELSTEIPIAASELAGIGEAAGQLGIANEYLLEFTETMANLGVATNMTSEQAATDLARLANITGMAQTEFGNLGSAIVELGNTFATTESEITAMATNMASAGTQAGLSEADILGFAAAVSSLGIEAQAGGTAMSKVFAMLQTAVETNSEALTDYAEVAGMTGEQFKKAFQEDAAGAITSFITGLGNVERSGKSATVILNDLGITETRLSNALKSLAGSGDLLTGAIESSNAAWTENTALTNEAEAAYSTMANRIQLAENELAIIGETLYQNLQEPIGIIVDGVKGLAEAFNSLPEGLQDTILQAGVLVAAIGAAQTAVSAYNTVKQALALISGTAATATAAETLATTANTAAITTNTAAMTLGEAAQLAFATATKAVTTALAANPIAAVAAAAFVAVKAYDALTTSAAEQVEKFENAKTAYQKANDTLSATEAELADVRDRMTELQGLEMPTLADEQELETLTLTNAQLEARLALEQELAKLAENDLDKTTVDTLDKIYGSATAFSEYLQGSIDAYNSYQAEIDKLNASLLTLDTSVEDGAKKWEEYTQQMSYWESMQANALVNIEDATGAIDEYSDSLLGGTDASAEWAAALENGNNAVGGLNITLEEVVDTTDDTADSLDDVADSADDAAISFADLKKAYEDSKLKADDYVDGLVDLSKQMAKVDDAGKEHKGAFGDIAEAIEDAGGYTKTFIKQEEDMRDTLEMLSEAFDENGDAVELSTSQIIDMIDAGYAAAIQFDEETGAAYANEEAMLALAVAEIEVMIAQQELAKSDLETKLKSLSVQLKTAEELHLANAEALALEVAATQALINESDDISARYNNIIDQLNNGTKGLNSFGSSANSAGKSASSGAKSTKDATDKVSDAIKDEIDQLEKLRKNGDITYRDMIASLENMLASYSLNAAEREKIEEELAAAYSDLLDDEISKLEKLQKAGKLTYKEMAQALEDMLDTYTMTAAERISLEEKVAEAQKSYISEVQDATVEYANLVSQAIQNRYQEEYDARATAINDNLTALSDAAYDEYTIAYDTSNSKISLYSTEYTEKLRLIDETTGAAVAGLNEEILKELELLGIRTDGYEDQIAAQQAIIEANAAARAAEKIAEEDAKYEKQRAAYEEQLLAAETAEARAKIQDQLDTLNENRAKTLRERERTAADEAAKEEINRINDVAKADIEATTKAIEEKKKLQDEYISDLEESLNSDLDTAGTTLEEQLANADKEAAALVTTSEESQQAALAVLEEYYPEWREAGKTMVDYISEGLQENQGDFIDELDTTGVLAMEGFIAGLESQRDEIVLQARSLAQAFMDEFNAVLDIHSPSREASWSGQMFGQGFTTGIEDSIGTVMSAARNLGLAAIGGLNGASAGAPALGLAGAGGAVSYDNSLHLSIGNYNQNTNTDLQALSEELRFLQNSQNTGKGAR